MADFFFVRNLTPSGAMSLSDVSRVADALRSGGLAVLPTETGYMLAADATDVAAVRSGFAVKRRPLSKTMHIACSSLRMAARYAILTPPAVRLLGELTPGPVSVIVEESGERLAEHVVLAGTVGIRVPDSPATLQVIEELGRPVTATSLNESGSPAISDLDADLQALDWPSSGTVHVVDTGARPRHSSGSTLVRTTGSAIEILRHGPVPESTIARVLATAGHLGDAPKQ